MNFLEEINEAIATLDDGELYNKIHSYDVLLTWVIDVGRWEYTVRQVLTNGDGFVEVIYNQPNTEMQDCEMNATARWVTAVQEEVVNYV